MFLPNVAAGDGDETLLVIERHREKSHSIVRFTKLSGIDFDGPPRRLDHDARPILRHPDGNDFRETVTTADAVPQLLAGLANTADAAGIQAALAVGDFHESRQEICILRPAHEIGFRWPSRVTPDAPCEFTAGTNRRDRLPTLIAEGHLWIVTHG